MTVVWPEKMARRMLFQSAKDLTPERGSQWLETSACETMCAQAKVSYSDFIEAVRYLLNKSPFQRALLLQNLKKHIGA